MDTDIGVDIGVDEACAVVFRGDCVGVLATDEEE